MASQSKEYLRAWRAKNRDRLNAKAKARRAANPEKFRAAEKKYAAANFERRRATGRRWFLKNKDAEYTRRKNLRVTDPRHTILSGAKVRARMKGLVFALTLGDIVIPRICPVLGIPIQVNHGKPGPSSPSLDRMNNTLGYIRGNVIVISHRANALKSDGTPEELMAVAKYAVDNRW